MTDIKEIASEQLRQSSWWGGSGQALPELYVEQLITEIDGLSAQVDRLRSFIESNMYDAPGEASRRAMDIIKETPSASTARIKAQALRELIKEASVIDLEPVMFSTDIIHKMIDKFESESNDA